MLVYVAADEGTGDPDIPLTETPICDGAYDAWESNIKLWGYSFGSYSYAENFDSTATPLNPIFIGRTSATIDNSWASVLETEENATDGFGRYSIPGDSGGKSILIDGSYGANTSITFADNIGALSFYLTDVDDTVYGKTSINVYDENDNLIQTIIPSNNFSFESIRESNVVFIGLICTDPNILIRKITFSFSSAGGPDFLSLDQLSVALYGELCSNPVQYKVLSNNNGYMPLGASIGDDSSHYCNSFTSPATGPVIIAEQWLDIYRTDSYKSKFAIKITGILNNDLAQGPDLNNVYAESAEFEPIFNSYFYEIASWTNYTPLIENEVYFYVLYCTNRHNGTATAYAVGSPGEIQGIATNLAKAFWYSNDDGVTWGYEFGPECPNNKTYGFSLAICTPLLTTRKQTLIWVTT